MVPITRRTSKSIVEQSCTCVGNEGIPAGLETQRRLEDSGVDLLPGIPDEVTLAMIIPKLGWKDCAVVSNLNSTWRKASKARLVYNARVMSSSAETLAVVPQGSRQISLYSINDKFWYNLPLFTFSGGTPKGYECISLDGRLYVMGGLVETQVKSGDKRKTKCHSEFASNKVYMLDVAGKGTWEPCASMHKPRFDFGAGVVEGKICVFGGRSDSKLISGWEVYDPKVDSWTLVESGASVRTGHRVATVGDELFVYGGDEPGRLHFVDAFDTVTHSWRRIRNSEGEFWDSVFMVQGEFYKIINCCVFVYDMNKGSWSLRHMFLGCPDGIQVHSVPLGGRVLAVGGELLIVTCKPQAASRGRQCLLQSRGFGKTSAIEWHIANRDLGFEDQKSWICSIAL